MKSRTAAPPGSSNKQKADDGGCLRRRSQSCDSTQWKHPTAAAKLSKSPLPDPAFQAVVHALAIATRKGRAWKGTVHSAVHELAFLDGHRPPAERYAGISVPVLVLYGSDSDEFYLVLAKALSAHLLHGRCTAVPGADHGALDRAPRTLIFQLSEFFAHGS